MTPPKPETTPKQYRALTGLSYPTDPSVIARLAAGERLTREERGVLKEVGSGDVVSDIPTHSLPWLLEQGLIEEA